MLKLTVCIVHSKGASSGIGRAIAFELVARKIGKLAIVGRNQEKLEKTAEELRQAGALEVRTIVADLSSHEGPATVEKKLKDEFQWTLDILVNNAGLAAKETFAKNLETDTALASIDVMVRAVVDLSLRFLPGMIERRRGGILNVGSTAAYQPVPWTATYAACKAFVLSWSQAIREENKDTGVRIACIVPGITKTNLDGHGGGETRGTLDKVGIHDPADVATAAINAYEHNSAAHIIGVNNKLLRLAGVPVPASVMASIVASSRGPPEDE